MFTTNGATQLLTPSPATMPPLGEAGQEGDINTAQIVALWYGVLLADAVLAASGAWLTAIAATTAALIYSLGDHPRASHKRVVAAILIPAAAIGCFAWYAIAADRATNEKLIAPDRAANEELIAADRAANDKLWASLTPEQRAAARSANRYLVDVGLSETEWADMYARGAVR